MVNDEVKKLADKCAKKFPWKTQAEWFNILAQIEVCNGDRRMMNKTNELLNKLNENIERGNRILVVVTAVNILTVLMIGLVLL